MGNFVVQGLEVIKQFLVIKQLKYVVNVYQIEDVVNNFDWKIIDYLIEFFLSFFLEYEFEEYYMLMDIVRDIERIGDYFENVIELIEYQQVYCVVIIEFVMVDLMEMMDLMIFIVKVLIEVLYYNDVKIVE